MTNDNLQALSDAGVSIWLDDLSRDRLDSGNLAELVKVRNVVGVTTNPSIFQAAMSQGTAYDDQIGKISLIGAGMRSHPGVSAKFFACLGDAGVNIEMISTSEIRISVIVRGDDVNTAVTAVHKAFDLDAEDGEAAVVYGGTGR